MNPRVLLRRQVPDDLHSIIIFLDQHSVEVADRFLTAVFTAMQDLATMPRKGSPKHFRNKTLTGLRSWSVPGFRNFLIFYRPMEDGIDVLAVLHGARNLRPLLKGRTKY